MRKFDEFPEDAAVDRAVDSLRKNGITVHLADNGNQAREKALELIPKGAEVFTLTSTTVTNIGLAYDLDETGKYDSIRKKFQKMDRLKDGKLMRQMGAAADYAVGSVNAITEDGELLFASHSGSQLASYAFSAQKVIWIASTMKIVKDLKEANRRINKYVVPLESERAKKAYGSSGTEINKLLIFSKELNRDRCTLILTKEKLGF